MAKKKFDFTAALLSSAVTKKGTRKVVNASQKKQNARIDKIGERVEAIITMLNGGTGSGFAITDAPADEYDPDDFED